MNVTTQIGIAVFSGLVCVWFGYRLSIGRDTLNRRRVFRSKARNIAATILEKHPDYLIDFFEEFRAHFRSDCISIIDDVPLWKRKRFGQQQRAFLDLKDADMTPPPPGGFISEDKDIKKREFQQARTNLYNLINSIADAS